MYKIILAVAASVAILSIVQATSVLHEVPKEDSPKANLNLTEIKEDFVQKHPDVVKWFERAVQRVKEGRNASSEDIMEVRLYLDDMREHIYEFVTSPIFYISTDMLIDRVITLAAPFLGVLPLKEIHDLFDILKKDQGLSKELLEGDKELSELVPVAAEFDQWLANSTSHLLENTMASIAPVNGTNATVVLA